MAMARLIWKEWREQRWRIGFGCVVLCAFALIGLRTRAVDDESILIGTCAIGVLLLPILAAAGLIPAERDEGTLRLLLSLPVAPWKVLAAKSLMGAALCAVPLAAAAVVSVAIARGREVSTPATLAIFGGSIATALLLCVWMLALTARSEGEGRAAGLAVGILIFWLLALIGLEHVVLAYQSEAVRAARAAGTLPSTRAETYYAITPFVLAIATDSVARVVGVAVQIAAAVALWFWAVRALASSASEGR